MDQIRSAASYSQSLLLGFYVILHLRRLLCCSKNILGRPTPRLMLTNGSAAPGAAIKAAR